MATPSSRETRSRRKKKETADAVEQEDTAEETRGDKKNERGLSSRELRRRARDEQRSRTLGIGLVIPSETRQSSTKHVVFGDEDIQASHADKDAQTTSNSEERGQGVDELEEEQEENDHGVEEVKSNVAREQAMQQRAMERETAKVHKMQSNTKKRKKTADTLKEEPNSQSGINEEDEFDDDFFAKVDSEMVSNRQRLRDSRKRLQTMGRHTTFVSANDEATEGGPIHVDHNIELVVLGREDSESETKGGGYEERLHSMGARMGTQPSEAALVFSRNKLVSGDDQPSKKMRTEKKSMAKSHELQGWRRSKKMNRLTSSRARVHRRGGRGVAAAHFVKKR